VIVDLQTAQSRESYQALLDHVCRASSDQFEVVALRANGAAVTQASRDELLAKCSAGEYVELELDVKAYEQQAGVQNRKFVRVRDGGMMSMGRTGKGKPFLRDHEQWDVNARAGTITSSAAEKLGDAHYAVKLSAKLTAPWAVDLALRGLLTAVSIGLNPIGPVMCSACDTPVFTSCWHCPGDRLSEQVGDDGKTRKMRDRTGSIVVEWVFTDAEIVECSVCSVPAVPSAQIEAIRAALSAHNDSRAIPAHSGEQHAEENTRMKNFAVLVATLGLAATASEDEVLRAVEEQKRERDAAKAELAISQKELAVVQKENLELSGDKKKSAEDKFIGEALATGKIHKGSEPEWREFYQLSPDRAVARMSAKAPGVATPVGLERQSGGVDPTPAPAASTAPVAAVRSQLTADGVNADMAINMATAFGAKKPESSVAQAIGLKKTEV
jgi:hypothetical protein